MEIINAQITGTTITRDGIAIAIGSIYNGKEVNVALPIQFTIDAIKQCLDIGGAQSWEQLVGKPIRLGVERNEDNLELKKIGHFLQEGWIETTSAKKDTNEENLDS